MEWIILPLDSLPNLNGIKYNISPQYTFSFWLDKLER